MSDDLTDSQVALLCALGEFSEIKASGDQRRDLERLLVDGYIERVEGRAGPRFKPTRKGMEFLGERGAGLNEA